MMIFALKLLCGLSFILTCILLICVAFCPDRKNILSFAISVLTFLGSFAGQRYISALMGEP